MTQIVGVVASTPLGNIEPKVRAMRSSSGLSAGIASFDDQGLRGMGAGGEVFRTPRLFVLFSGHIYNSADFVPAGSDAELFARLYEDYGIDDALGRINGDFALVVCDLGRRETILARDRFGLKPFYYSIAGELLAFASRPAALLCLQGVDRTPNRQFAGIFAGSHYRYFDNQPEASPFNGVRQVPAGHYVAIRDWKCATRCYWQLRDEEPVASGSFEDLCSQYRDLLVDSVKIRLARAQAPGFTLSGGMDSSSVLAAAVQGAGARQPAYSTTYVDKTYDESDEIQSMLATCVSNWHKVEIGSPDVFGLVAEMVAQHHEPVATATWLSHYLLCKNASEGGIKSLFGGLGGDELNAGEYEHFFYFFADLRGNGEEARLAQEVRMWAHYHDHPVFRKDFAVMEQQLRLLTDPRQPGRCLADKRRLLRYAGMVKPSYFDVAAFVPEMDHPFRTYLNNRCYQDIARETVPCSLRAEDRNTGAFGLDNFLPFFDHRLAEFMFKVPAELKYKDGVTKWLLRGAMTGILPEETRTRVKKTGWNAPAHQWFAGKSGAPLRDLIYSRRFRERGIYNIDAVRDLLAEHEDIVSRALVKDSHMMFFWQLVNLEIWLDWIEALPAPV